MLSLTRLAAYKKLAVCLVVMSTLATFLHLRWSSFLVSDRFTMNYLRRLDSGLHNKTPAVCHLPDYDPFHRTLRPYLRNFSLVCPLEPYLTYADRNGFLHLNRSGFADANIPIEDVNCTFSSIEISPTYTVKHGLERIIPLKPIFMDAEYVSVKCIMGTKIIYRKVHYYFPERNETIMERSRELRKEGKMSVLLVHLDSMSRLSVLRTLPKSYGYLTGRLGAVVFRGMSKLEINTHPNMLAFLTGHKYKARNPGHGTPTHTRTGGWFDRLPLVWRNFSAAGYLTEWADEMGKQGLFYLDASGFRTRPADYHPRALFLEMEAMGLKPTDLCFGNTPMHLFMLDYTEKFLAAMNDSTYFAYNIITRVSHDDPNFPQSMDDHLFKFMEKAFNDGHLDNTVFLLFGDHGLRFGDIRTTLIGGVEDRMPFLSVYLPERLRRERPHLQAGLEANAGQLMSWFDMYEFLMDFAMDNLGEKSVVERWGRGVGVSPLRPLPHGRTCSDAGIPRQYCPCLTAIEVAPVGGDVATRLAALRLIDWVNALLQVEGAGRMCAKLRLQSVEGAQLLAHEKSVIVTHGFVEILRVTVRATPGEALFQGVIERRADDTDGRVIGDVERINKYGNQSHCVAAHSDQRLRMYCVCV